MLKETKRSDEIKHYLYALRWARVSEGGRRREREEGRDEGGRETERGEWEGGRVRERERESAVYGHKWGQDIVVSVVSQRFWVRFPIQHSLSEPDPLPVIGRHRGSE